MERYALPWYETEIGRWLGALEESRADLLEVLDGMTHEELHTELVPGAHSIAAILWHMANVELWWNRAVLRGEEITEQMRAEFGLTRPGDMNRPPDTMTLDRFLSLMATARSLTVESYRTVTENGAHLADRAMPGRNRRFSPAWILYNLVDHEANHRGQVAMLLRLIRSRR